MGNLVDGHAVVAGGSIAGLLAARTLADVYSQVTVIDRDRSVAAFGPRRGVPQGRHIHAVLARGQQVLEELFPGLTEEMVTHGAHVGDVLGDARLCFAGHRLVRTPVGLTAVSASRPFLEGHVRARVVALPNVTFAPQADVVGLLSSTSGRRVTGVRVLRRSDGSAEETVAADLVVDATGRASRAPSWLEAIGFGSPAEDRVAVAVAYATRRYLLPPAALDGDVACVIGPTADHLRGGAVARLEGDVAMATLFGMLGDRPPTDPEGFLAFARTLCFPDIAEVLSSAEPLDDGVPFHFTANVRRRYERMRHLPDGFVVTGDALCSFNPIYGQGMTVAALQALALRDHAGRSRSSGRAAARALAAATEGTWRLTTGADLSLPGIEGRGPAGGRLVSRYVGRVQRAAAHDAKVARAFVRVTGLVDPPEALLLRPATVARVLAPRRQRPAARRPASAPMPGGAPGTT
jgi:2-polyprenyl-6-methoxyphenol hydroxylase-like FAD-dependent oxidoreductase